MVAAVTDCDKASVRFIAVSKLLAVCLVSHQS